MRLHDIDAVAQRVQSIVDYIEAHSHLRKSEADTLRQLRSLQWAFSKVRGRLVRQRALPQQSSRRHRFAEATRVAA